MSLELYHTKLKELLSNDPALSDWVIKYAEQSFNYIDGNLPLSMITSTDLPLLMFEWAGADFSPQLGNTSLEAKLQSVITIGWLENDNLRAAQARKELLPLLPKALMNNPTVTGAANWAYVSRVEPDQGLQAPQQFVTCIVEAELNVLNP